LRGVLASKVLFRPLSHAFSAWNVEQSMWLTSSFRLSEKLLERLDRFARNGRVTKSAVIVKAIETYLDQHERTTLAAEARRQSLLANTAGSDADWLDQADQSGWE
jgi:predicted DNA-binding protein